MPSLEVDQELESDRYEELGVSGEWEQSASCPQPTRATVGGFSRYSNAIASLPASEKLKIQNIARAIVASHRPGCRPVRNVQLVGHADRDLERERRQPGFMAAISRQRAQAIQHALQDLINNPSISSRIAWGVRGIGADNLLIPNPATEQQRARNRRVEVALSTASPAPRNWEAAVRENRRYARSLGWQAYATAIMRLLGFVTAIPGESAFAEAVARWQSSRSLAPNGIIGRQTLALMRAALQTLKCFPGDDPRPAVSSQEIPPDPLVLRQLQREFQHEAGEESDKFVTEQIFGFPQGHKHLTELAAAGLPITAADLDALKDGVARVDELKKAFDAPEQRRHTLRRFKCQPVADALSEARNHLIRVHSLALAARGRTEQFEFFGESLHLIQDSYSTAHTERQWRGPGSVHPIVFIRFFGFQGSCTFPLEHRVVPPPDPRDTIKAGGTLTPFAREAISASREYLTMALRHLSSPGSSTIPGDLRRFMDRHLLLSPTHTPTTACYPACPNPAAPCRCP